MSDVATASGDQGPTLLALYDDALPEVYGYLLRRCGDEGTAEDLTSETFMAAVDGVQRGRIPDLSIAWLIGVARHKLVDHWRRREREERKLQAVEAEPNADVDEWEQEVDAVVAREVLASLAPQHQAALTLRYLDGLSVPEAAGHLGRTIHATEALLVRAKKAFREAYGERSDDA